MRKGVQHLRMMHRQLGQGMAEYIIIMALVAVAAVGVFQHLGGVVQQQGAAISLELAGGDGSTAPAQEQADEAVTDADAESGLDTYVDKN